MSPAIPKADENYATAVEPDPLQFLLTGCAVSVPAQVEGELWEMAGYDDVHAAAATTVRAASEHYRVVDPLDREKEPDELPAHGLGEGETAAVLLANALGVDALLTDEFQQLARIHALVEGATLVPTPRLLHDYARVERLRTAQVRRLVETIAPHRSWVENSYVQAVLATL